MWMNRLNILKSIATAALCVWSSMAWCEDSPNQTKGLQVSGDPGDLPELRALETEVTSAEARVRELRGHLLRMQDNLASRLRDVSPLSVVVELRSGHEDMVDLGLQEVTVTLDDFTLVRLVSPLRQQREEVIPVYHGPIPYGEYEVSVRAVVGFLQHKWPHALPQGRWLLERKVQLRVPRESTNHKLSFVIRPVEGVPTLEVVKTAEERS